MERVGDVEISSRVSETGTNGNVPYRPQSEPERRVERLGFALRGLAADLAEERRKAAKLRREVAELRTRLEHPAVDAQRRPRPPERGLR